MDAKVYAELRATRKQMEKLEALAVHELETERDRIQELKKELEERTDKRNKLMLELIAFGFTKDRAAKCGGVAPSYINHLESKK